MYELLGSQVEPVVADFMDVDLTSLGQFDIVIYAGVLYHMKGPLRALQRVASVTRELAVVETEAIRVANYGGHALWEFFGSSELGADISNWWAPTEAGLVGACRAAGFSSVRILTTAPAEDGSGLTSEFPSEEFKPSPLHYRLIAYAIEQLRSSEYSPIDINLNATHSPTTCSSLAA